MQGGGAIGGQFGFQAVADGGVGAGEVQVAEGAANVEAGPADEDRYPAARGDVIDDGAGQPLVVGHVGGLADVPDVQQVVRYAPPFRRGELGGPDVHAPVELHRVGVDHLTAEGERQADRERRLARRGRAHHGDDLAGAGRPAWLARRPGEAPLRGERRVSRDSAVIERRASDGAGQGRHAERYRPRPGRPGLVG